MCPQNQKSPPFTVLDLIFNNKIHIQTFHARIEHTSIDTYSITITYTLIVTPSYIYLLQSVYALFQHLKTTGNMFIVNLAMADLCVTAFVDPFSVVGWYRLESVLP